jgi:hypothetical protein
MMTILSLCDGSGAWSAPYRAAGYDVVPVDLRDGVDVRLVEYRFPVRGVLAAPPCTDFASSGARWWKGKGEAPLLASLAVVDACCRIILAHRPQWWVLENPIGRLARWLGPPRMKFDPADYGDPYTKRTCLWGDFTEPLMLHRVAVTAGSMTHRLPPSPDRAALRSVTPAGFAAAFFEANP